MFSVGKGDIYIEELLFLCRLECSFIEELIRVVFWGKISFSHEMLVVGWIRVIGIVIDEPTWLGEIGTTNELSELSKGECFSLKMTLREIKFLALVDKQI